MPARSADAPLAQFLFIVVIVLFGVMNVGALFGFYEDMKERRELLEHITRPECGFAERPDGAWTWTFRQNLLQRAVERPSGSAVEIAAVLGFPFIRLRAALPEELFAGSVAQSLGRKDGMSATGLLAARDENLAVMQVLKHGMSCFSCRPADKIPDFEEGSHTEKSPAWNSHARGESLVGKAALLPPVSAHMLDYDDHIKSSETLEWMVHEPDPTDMVGTALCFAFMANQKVLPVVELAERQAAATAHFGELRVPGIDHSFSDLVSKFQVMLGPDAGTLTARGKWMQTARLWRFLILQRLDGCWGACPLLRCVLADCHACPRVRYIAASLLVLTCARHSFFLRRSDGLAGVRAGGARGPPPAQEGEGTAERLPGAHQRFRGRGRPGRQLRRRGRRLHELGWCARKRFFMLLSAHPPPHFMLRSAHPPPRADDELAPGAEEVDQHDAKHVKDCPISFSSTAARRRMPVSLLDLSGQRNHRWERAMTKRFAHAPPAEVEEPAAPPLPSKSLRLQPHLSKFFLLAEEEAELDAGAAGQEGALAEEAAPKEEEPPKPTGPISVQLAERIWATVLSLAVMEAMDVCWLVDDEAEPERTVVDAGREWLEARSEEDERIKELLESGELQKEAQRAIRDWKRIMENSVNQLRKNDVLNRFTALTHLQRASGRVIKSLMTDHGCVCSLLAAARALTWVCRTLATSTFATFLDADGYIMRWQRRAPCSCM